MRLVDAVCTMHHIESMHGIGRNGTRRVKTSAVVESSSKHKATVFRHVVPREAESDVNNLPLPSASATTTTLIACNY